jgi:hypothetical protein
MQMLSKFAHFPDRQALHLSIRAELIAALADGSTTTPSDKAYIREYLTGKGETIEYIPPALTDADHRPRLNELISELAQRTLKEIVSLHFALTCGSKQPVPEATFSPIGAANAGAGFDIRAVLDSPYFFN